MDTIDTTTGNTIGTLADARRPAQDAAQALRNTLRLNATTSMLGGLAAAVGPLDRLLDTGHPGWVRLVGLGLMAFAAGVAAAAGARLSRLLRWTPVIVAADVSWVVASTLTIVVGWFSAGGAVLVGVVAGVVALFAVQQLRTWRTAPRHAV